MTTFVDIIQRRDWENPQSVNIHCLKAHSPLHSFRHIDHARDGIHTQRQSLNGQWKFKLFDKPELVDGQFIETSFNDENWDEITVPSNGLLPNHRFTISRRSYPYSTHHL